MRRRDGQTHDQRVEAAVAGGGLAAGAGDREAADRGVLEGLREVAERQPVLGQQRPRPPGRGARARAPRSSSPGRPRAAGRAGTGPARPRPRTVAPGREPADDRRAATEGDQCDVALARTSRRPPAPRRGSAGRTTASGESEPSPCPQPQQVGRRLAAGAQHAGVVVGEHVVGADQSRRARPRSASSSGSLSRTSASGDGGVSARADEGVDEAAGGLRRAARPAGVAPAGPVHLVGSYVTV